MASNLVNLGNAFCDQQKHVEAVPVYLRALTIDEKALGHDHPEVAMDLSNLGIVYRVQGRRDEAIALFQRAHEMAQPPLPAAPGGRVVNHRDVHAFPYC